MSRTSFCSRCSRLGGVLADTSFHAAIGDPVMPALFGIITLGWFALRRPQLAFRRASAS